FPPPPRERNVQLPDSFLAAQGVVVKAAFLPWQRCFSQARIGGDRNSQERPETQLRKPRAGRTLPYPFSSPFPRLGKALETFQEEKKAGRERWENTGEQRALQDTGIALQQVPLCWEMDRDARVGRSVNYDLVAR